MRFVPRTFADVLRRRAAEGPDRPVYLFLDSEGQEAESLTHGELDRRAREIAAELQRQDGEGERALLLYPPGLEFLAAFWGCLYAGVVAVPAYPPRSGRTQPRLRAIAADAEAALVLAPAAIAATRETLAERVPELAAARWIATDELAAEGDPREPAAGPDDPAFLQYTSGSTADPKGVVVTHANLLANEETIRRAFGQSEASVVVGWLPLYHDMGLIGNALQPVYSGGRAVLMSPLTFLQRPARWLEAISRYRATTSGGPSFAYELCVRKVSAEERAGLDLSSWSVAFNGAEPVRAETLRRFAEAFAPCGFRPEAAYPCYGLAESTLFVTGGEPGVPPRILRLRTGALERGEAVPAREGEPAREHVGCGHAWPGHRVLVVDPESGAPCEPGRVGEIWVSGPSVAAGYRNRPEATAETFGARLADGSGPFLRTGDLGFLDGGELFVTGRLKDLIILRGRNHYPQDFERTAESAHPALRPGSGAAFSIEREGEERLVVVQEIEHERRAPGELAAIAEAARRAVAEEHEVAVEEVVLLRSGTVPKTSSGKVRRLACREAYLAGELVVVGRSLTEAAEAAAPASGLREAVAGVLRLPPDAVEPDRPLVALGLDSLAAVELKGRVEERFGVSLSLSALLEGATLEDVAAEVGKGGSLSREVLEGRGGGLTLNQRALWFVERLSPGSYNLAGAARVRGGLDPEALRRAFQALADRHSALRTTFEEQDGEPVRRVHERMQIDFATSADDLLAPFDLRRGPLMRVRLADGVLSLGIHHLAADFRSLAILLRELGALYRGESLPPPAPEPVPQEDTSEAAWAWWREALAGDLPVLDLATDRPRPPVQTYGGASRALRLEAERVRAWASSSGATLHTALLAAFHALLHRHTGQPDILVGVPTSGHGEAVGYFVNPVAVRLHLAGEPTAAELLARVKTAALGALEHAGFPFPLLAERLQPERDASRSPLFQAMLALQKARRPEEAAFAPFALGEEGAALDLGGLVLESVALPERRVPFDLTLMMAEAGDGLLASLQYNSDLFDPATAERMLGHFSHLLDGMASGPNRRIADLDLLSEPERRQLAAWVAAPSPGPEECLHRLVGAQVERTPDAVALVSGSRSLIYRELWDRAGALAGRLRQAGVGPEVRVGLFAGRAPELVVGMLAVLRAGGAYVPLDPAYPAERLAFLLEDSQAAVVLVEPGRELPRTDARVLPLGEEGEAADLPDEVLPANLAYLIYTSGSTGRPKAVALTHASAAALARWAREVFPEEDLAGVLASTSISFDLSVFEIFVPLCWGGRVVLVDNALELPRDQDVRLVNTVPSAMAELVRARALPASVRTVNLAGEALPPELVRDLYRTGTVERVFNLYGPSEDTTYSTFALQEREARSAPIGLPVAGTGAWLLDAAGLREVPLGARGEIHLGGEGLARGYFGRPDLTAERFVPSPFEPGARLYRTGDLARRRRDGSLEYLGRIDHQVKIRGFRVELGEVEAALRGLPGVREAAVLAVEAARLVAFVTGAAPDRQVLRQRLPEALVPSAIVSLDALPLTPNGKVDRKALARRAAESGTTAVWRAPSTPGEALLAGIWGEVLGTDRVGADDGFFALGGHSLLAARVQARVRERLDVELPLSAFFQSPTVAALALHLEGAAASAVPPPERLPRDGRGFPLSFAQERLWLLERLEPGSAVYHMAGGARLEGPLDLPGLRRALAGLAARHEILRTSFPEEEGGRPLQRIGSGAPELPVTCLAGLPGDLREREAERLALEEARRSFDLAGGLPWRARLLRMGEESHTLLLTLHHIAADEESLEVLVEDLAALYLQESPRPDPFQYADFAAWQRRHLESLEPRLDWWAERLAGLATLELPADRPGAVRGPRGGRVTRELPDPTGFDRTTPFLVLLAGFQAFLGRVTGAEDVPVGCPVSRRDRRELEDAVGLFVNTLVLRGDFSGGPGFRELLGRVRTAVAEAHERDVPFELLVARLRPERTLGRNPLFDAAFALHRPPRSRRLGELALSPLQVHTGTAKFDLILFALETGSGLTLSLEYASDLFDAVTAERLLGGFETLLAAALAEPDRPLTDLPLLSEPERRQLLEWGTGAAFPPSALPVHRRVEEQAGRAPEALAMASEAESITYGELNRCADLLARDLRERGVGPERIVAIALDRSVESVVAALAVLKAGGAYLPLDPAHPQERLAAIMEDSGAFLLGGEGAPSPAQRGRAGEGVFPESAAYVIYTSGSTGAPKGVAVSHAALSNLVDWHLRAYRLTPEDRASLVAGPGFDAAVWEVWPVLAAGASLHVPAETVRSSPEALRDWLAAERITVSFLPTPLAEALMEESPPQPLRALLTGGDRLHRHPAPGSGWPLVNHYGPTEVTVVSTSTPVEEGGDGAPPIGRPIDGITARVADPAGGLLPAGVPGELLLGGAGLARGYLGRPDLTAERFVPDPLGSGDRLYRSGDRARFRADGRLDFLGRIDAQVKIRGVRIEPGEVEAVLAAHPGLREAAVAARGGRLVAWVVPRDGEVTASDLRAWLRRKLAEPMVPSAFVTLPGLPLTPNGKVDRRALPDPGPGAGEKSAPLNSLEEGVAAVWAEVLGLDADEVGRDDDFFGAGGHSLLAPRLAARLRETFGADLPLRTVFERPTVAGLAAAISDTRGEPVLPLPRIERVPRRPPPPLALSQERLWFLDQLEPGSPVYNLPLPLRLQGKLDVRALRRTFQGIVDRHEALRTTFRSVAGRPVQEAAPELAFALPLVDLSGLAAERGRAEALRLAADEALRPFFLDRGPLLRATLLRLDRDEQALLLNVHHIVADGRSMGVLLRELKALYGGETLPPLPVQYADYAAWQRRRLDGESLAEPLAWWRRRLAGAPAVMELPLDRPRPAVQGFRGGSSRLELGPEETRALRGLGRSHGASLFLTLLAVLAALLRRVTGQGDLVLGTPTANRPRPELEPLVGFFVNNLVLRLDAAGDPPFRGLLAGVREAGLASYAREIPFEKLLEELRPERDLSHNPLYQVVFALEGTDRPELSLPGGVRLSPLPVGSGTAKFDLALYMEEGPGGLSGLLEYNRDLFDNTTAARLLKGFAALAREAARHPERRLLELPLLDEAERHQALVEANDTAAERPENPFVHRWIEARAAEAPDAPALRREGRSLTYGEMNRRANRLAHRLIRLGVRPETRVAVALERSPELIVTMLAIWKAGGAYVPLDVAYPKDRLEAMLRDSGAAVLLTSAGFPVPESQAVPLLLDETWSDLAAEPGSDPGVPLLPEHLVYAIYTSGSTGRPKGVMIQHGSLASYAVTAARAYGVVPGDRVLQFCSVSFDISIEEIVPCLTRGAELVLRTDEMIESIPAFLDACREWGLTLLSLPTAYWHEIVARVDAGTLALPPSLRLVIIAGERALPERLVAWQRHAPERPRLINTYGVTESTIISTVGDLTASPADGVREVSIGRTIPDTELYLLDRALQPVPLGVAGELFIGGNLLARGYHDRPSVTAERFVPHVFSRVAGERLYRTGDLARALPNGELEFLGRGDHQVKIRGYRIELGEIEAALDRHPDLDAVAVAAPEDRPGQKRLVACVVPGRRRPTPGELRTFLAGSLPEYMLPGVFLFLDALPMTPNGKVDRGALPSARDQRSEEGEYLAPRDEVEKAVAEVWQRALGVERVGIHDNFFDLGGHSLLLIQVAEGLKERFGRAVPMVELFKHPTVDSLARHLSQARMEEAAPEPLQEARDRATRARATRTGPDRFLAARRRIQPEESREDGYDAG